MSKQKKYKSCLRISMGTICWMLTTTFLAAQQLKNLTIEECYRSAKSNYPLIRQMDLIEKATGYTIENISKGYLPQININGQATYQSEVTKIPIDVPGISPVSKDQYKIYSEVYQGFTEGRIIKQQTVLANANAATEKQKIEVELYKLKERINQLFFGILLLDAQLHQAELLKKDIQAGLDRTNAAIANGTAFKSNADLLKAELLKADQHTIELRSNRTAYINMLSIFIKQTVNDNTQLEAPSPQPLSSIINRPEIKLYEVQNKAYDIQRKLITTKNLPGARVFLQGGYGRPALNQLKNDFSFYYIGGLRLHWNLGGFYTAKKERALLDIQQSTLDLQKETFILNTGLSLSEQNTEVNKFNELIATDNEIIVLREKIKQVSKSQLENGTITTNDYMTYVNAEDQARQSQLLHQVQLLMAQYNYKTTSGN
ncbi:MAG: TolC family protein [Ferruginibacter sp.]